MDLPKWTGLWTSVRSPKGRLGLYLARFHITEPQLSKAGPSSSFLFHLPAARLLTNIYRHRAACSGFPARRELPQHLAMPIEPPRWWPRWSITTTPAGLCGLLAATLRAENKQGSSYSGLWVFPNAAHTPQVTGLEQSAGGIPNVSCARSSRLAFRKAFAVCSPKSEKQQPPGSPEH